MHGIRRIPSEPSRISCYLVKIPIPQDGECEGKTTKPQIESRSQRGYPVILRVTVPTRVVLNREVTYVQAEDPSGRFGILPRHEPYLTAVAPSILVYRYGTPGRERESYIAVRHGVLRVTKDEVQVAVREAHRSDDLAALQDEIRRYRENRKGRSYRSTRSLYQMQIAAWRPHMEHEDVRAR